MLFLDEVENLRQLFPDVPTSEVRDALEAVNGNVDEAAGVILQQSTTGGSHFASLELRCRELLLQGLAPSTRRSYATGQKKFINFCTQLGKVGANGSVCPADEWTLCLFATFLSNFIQSSSIKVYLSAVCALHIEQGFPDPLLNCLRLERVVKGIKCIQGVKMIDRLPITDDIMSTIYSHLKMALADHSMFWAACCLAYLAFYVLRNLQFPA